MFHQTLKLSHQLMPNRILIIMFNNLLFFDFPTQSSLSTYTTSSNTRVRTPIRHRLGLSKAEVQAGNPSKRLIMAISGIFVGPDFGELRP